MTTTANASGMAANAGTCTTRRWSTSAVGWKWPATPVERGIYAVGGGALIACGMRRGSAIGMLMAAAGGLMLYHGATGYSLLTRMSGYDERECLDGRPAGNTQRRRFEEFDQADDKDAVEEASEQSFPASDPPAIAHVRA